MKYTALADRWYGTVHVAIMFALTWCLFSMFSFNSPFLLIASFVIFKLAERLGLYVGLHMWVNHQIIHPSGVYKWAVLLSMLVSNIARPSFFSRYHEIHHMYSDSTKDPHSPVNHNKWYLIFGLYPMTMYRYFNHMQSGTFHRCNESISSDVALTTLDTHYYKILTAIAVIGGLISVEHTFYFLLLPMFLCNVNNNIFFVYYLHRGGKARNDKWINYWIPDRGGEHRTHHMVGRVSS